MVTCSDHYSHSLVLAGVDRWESRDNSVVAVLLRYPDVLPYGGKERPDDEAFSEGLD